MIKKSELIELKSFTLKERPSIDKILSFIPVKSLHKEVNLHNV